MIGKGIALVLWSILAFQCAQAAEPDKKAPAKEREPLYVGHGTEPIDACIAKWDPGTHMSKAAWRESCQRIKSEREPYLRNR